MNVMEMMMQAMRGGMNPSQWLEQEAGENPQLQSLYEIVHGKNPDELRETAANMAKQRGLQYEEIEQQMAQHMGFGVPRGQNTRLKGDRGARTPSHTFPFFKR